MENELASERIQVERKQFFFDLKENQRGRFLKITEDVGGRRDTVIIPSTGLELFRDALDKVIVQEKALRKDDKPEEAQESAEEKQLHG